MSVQELNEALDRAFFDEWLAMITAPLAKIPTPHNRDSAAIASYCCQLAVLYLLEKRGAVAADMKVPDFAMEFVARMWPMLISNQPVVERPRYKPWTDGSSLTFNLDVAEDYEILLASLRQILAPFSRLTERDRSEIVYRCPVAPHVYEAFLTAEENRARELIRAPIVLSYLDRQLQLALNRAGLTVKDETQNLFAGIPGEPFQQLAREAAPIQHLLLAHRRLSVPPPSHYDDDFLCLTTASEMVEKMNEYICTTDLGASTIAGCLRTTLFPSSYEAAHQLLLSDAFLTDVTGRDSRKRDRTGFQFWQDLRVPTTFAAERVLIGRLSAYYRSLFPHFSSREIAGIIVRTPFIIFLECARPHEV